MKFRQTTYLKIPKDKYKIKTRKVSEDTPTTYLNYDATFWGIWFIHHTWDHHCIAIVSLPSILFLCIGKENLASIWYILFLLHWIGRNQVIHIRILGPAHHIIQTTDIVSFIWQSFQSFTISASPFIQIVCTSTILVVLNFKCPRYIYSLRLVQVFINLCSTYDS